MNADSISGILLIDKPKGSTSHDIVDTIRRNFRFKKVGHAGTLDPMATGLLIILIGNATKLSQSMTALSKAYEGTMRLGESTDSHDADGVITEVRPTDGVSEKIIKSTAKDFIGEQYQVPPMFSAKKVNGEKLYKLARKGEVIDRPPQLINIYKFDIACIKGCDVDFFVECSKGTYVRTLANDFGKKIGCGAHLIQLRRTAIGDFSIDHSITVDALCKMSIDELSSIIFPTRVP